jgi:7,8-dihydropterin-6-yl-methyl-4-(beta-D-ribofuranosyl)aminobenzene 5'-phosphate synthase
VRQADLSITIVDDNHALGGLASEHGLSLWIETGGRRILLDTGQGAAFDQNVSALGIDLSSTDALVISHGHYDHTGGVPRVVREAPQAEVYFHPGVLRPRYSIRDGVVKRIDLPQVARSALESLPPARVHRVEGVVTLTERVGLNAPIPRSTGYEDTGGPFYLDPEGSEPDPIADDLALSVETGRGLVVCLGCAHAGVVNTLDHVLSVNRGGRVRAVVGGFHLGSASDERMAETISALRSLSPELVVPCHCTGEAATATLAGALGEVVRPGAAGMKLEF